MAEPVRLYPVWVHRLVFPFRYGKLLAGLLVFALVWLFLSGGAWRDELGFFARVFFAAMFAYIVPVFSATVERSLEAFDEIEGMLDVSEEERARWRLTLTHRSARWFVLATALALVLGTLNIMVDKSATGRGPMDDILSGQGEYVAYASILLIWVTMSTAINALLSNAMLFARLGKHYLRIDLLHSPALLSVARVAVMSTLSVVGAQVLFVLLTLDAEAVWAVVLPGLVSMTITALALFLIPVWPLRRRLQAAKQEELAKINQRIEKLRPGGVTRLDDANCLDQLNRLLLYRREILQVSEWPFDLPALTRLGLYLIIPPLTWVGAALIENVVDALL